MSVNHVTPSQKTPEFLSFVNSGTAYVNGSFLYAGNASFATFCESITGAIANSSLTLVPSQYSQVVEGYKAIYESLANAVMPNSGIVEILFSINSPGAIVIQAALQIPFRYDIASFSGRLHSNARTAIQAKDGYISTPLRCSISHESIPSTSHILPVSSAAVYAFLVLRFLTLHIPRSFRYHDDAPSAKSRPSNWQHFSTEGRSWR